jgi:hypothetical protein
VAEADVAPPDRARTAIVRSPRYSAVSLYGAFCSVTTEFALNRAATATHAAYLQR